MTQNDRKLRKYYYFVSVLRKKQTVMTIPVGSRQFLNEWQLSDLPRVIPFTLLEFF